MKLTKLPVSRLERLEKLEQLRALEAGGIIQVGVVERSSVGIDTPEDYARFVERQRGPGRVAGPHMRLPDPKPALSQIGQNPDPRSQIGVS